MWQGSNHARLTAVSVLLVGLCPAIAQAGNYVQVSPLASELVGPFNESSKVQTNSHYDWFFIQGVNGAGFREHFDIRRNHR